MPKSKTDEAACSLALTPTPALAFLEDVEYFPPGVSPDGVLVRLARAGFDMRRAAEWAVRRGRATTVRALVSSGAAPGETVLLLAAELGRADVVRECADRVDVDARPPPPGERDARVRERLAMATTCGEAVVYVASMFGHDDVVRELLRSCRRRRTFRVPGLVLTVACNDGHAAVVRELLGAGVRAEGALLIAANRGHEAVVRELLGAGVVAGAANAISAAALNGHEAVATLLLQHVGLL